MKKIYLFSLLLFANNLISNAQNGGNAMNSLSLTANSIKLHVYPNPTFDKVQVEFTQYSPGISKVIVMDANGRVIGEQSIILNGKPTTLTFDLANQPPGIYFAKMETEKGVKTEKILVTR